MARADNDLLAMALVGYEAQKARLEAAIRDIQTQLGHRGPGRPKAATDGSSEASSKCVGTQTDWCCAEEALGRVEEKQAATAKAAVPKKRKLSAAGRRAIIEATRKRWAAVRKAAAKKTKPVAKVAAQKAATAVAS
jgi:hypothetical protein